MRKQPGYCFWSVATKPYAPLMQACIDSARAVGVFGDVVVLTEIPLNLCQSYDLLEFQYQDGLFPLFYLKLGMERLNYDYFVWLDADSRFYSPPCDLLKPMAQTPIHVPFGEPLGEGAVAQRYREAKLPGPFFHCSTAFWMVHHDFIEPLFEICRQYWQSTRTKTFSASLSETLGFAAHLLVADYKDHLPDAYGSIWREAAEVFPSEKTIGEGSPSYSPSIVHFKTGHKLRS